MKPCFIKIALLLTFATPLIASPLTKEPYIPPVPKEKLEKRVCSATQYETYTNYNFFFSLGPTNQQDSYNCTTIQPANSTCDYHGEVVSISAPIPYLDKNHQKNNQMVICIWKDIGKDGALKFDSCSQEIDPPPYSFSCT